MELPVFLPFYATFRIYYMESCKLIGLLLICCTYDMDLQVN